MKKRLLSITLVVLMALIILPLISFADTTYTDWTSETTLPTTSGAYKLTKDVTINKNVIIKADTAVTLDLSGHTVNFDGSSAKYLVQYI